MSARTAREQRISELLATRTRIDTEIRRLDPTVVIRDMPSLEVEMSAERARDIARHSIHNGYTHEQTAHALQIPVELITPLIAPRR